MTISEMIIKLAQLFAVHGDATVEIETVETGDHAFASDITEASFNTSVVAVHNVIYISHEV